MAYKEIGIMEALAEFVNGEDVLCVDIENSRILYLDEALDGLRFLIDEKEQISKDNNAGRPAKMKDVKGFIALAAAGWSADNLAGEFGIKEKTAKNYMKKFEAEIKEYAKKKEKKENEFEE